MQDREILKKIESAYCSNAKDCFDKVLSEIKGEKGDAVIMENGKSKKKRAMYSVIAVAACFLLAAAAVVGYLSVDRTFAVISIDVNPSIEITVNDKEKVIKAEAENDDAVKVLSGMNLKGSDITVAVNAVIGSMFRHGYLNENSNSVLLTVDGKDANAADELEIKLTKAVKDTLNGDGFKGAVISQAGLYDADAGDAAHQHNISRGKAKLISEIVKNHNGKYSFEELSGMSISELMLICGDTVEAVAKVNGEVSRNEFIGFDAAKKVALEHANVTEDKAWRLWCYIDTEDGRIVYTVEFENGGYEYEYNIDAHTKEIVDMEKDIDEDGDEALVPEGARISPENALFIALRHVGLKKSDIRSESVWFKWERGNLIYEVHFYIRNEDYLIWVNATSGAVFERYEHSVACN